eukprot:TRINITY_DN10430_c0_g1_i1.p1 TRINITY_DN10430_c0_g1~~TRINITY_DN10430_c0_g1_i1.p1  ORF type:complete len:157 (+),score=13.69 TRINITY_DN10430_c0_g1_i1:410-880(+)
MAAPQSTPDSRRLSIMTSAAALGAQPLPHGLAFDSHSAPFSRRNSENHTQVGNAIYGDPADTTHFGNRGSFSSASSHHGMVSDQAPIPLAPPPPAVPLFPYSSAPPAQHAAAPAPRQHDSRLISTQLNHMLYAKDGEMAYMVNRFVMFGQVRGISL